MPTDGNNRWLHYRAHRGTSKVDGEGKNVPRGAELPFEVPLCDRRCQRPGGALLSQNKLTCCCHVVGPDSPAGAVLSRRFESACRLAADHDPSRSVDGG